MRELPRRLLHICFCGITIPIVGVLAPHHVFLVGFSVFTVTILVIDLIRIKSEKLRKYAVQVMGSLIRPDEVHSLHSSTYLLIAGLVAYLLFGNVIASTALIFLGIGDPMAGMIGTKWGQTRIMKKSLEGSSAFFIAAFTAGALLSLMTHIPLYIIASGAFVAAVIELLTISINDNITIPLVSGAVVWGLMQFL